MCCEYTETPKCKIFDSIERWEQKICVWTKPKNDLCISIYPPCIPYMYILRISIVYSQTVQHIQMLKFNHIHDPFAGNHSHTNTMFTCKS